MNRFTLFRACRRAAMLAGTAGLALGASGAAFAQDAEPAGELDSRALLELMVEKGLVTRADADSLVARATRPARPAVASAVPAGGIEGDIQTVPYVPKVVREQLKRELRKELATQAVAENWARPGEVPEWTKRIELFGDIRVRGEGVLMSKSNGNRVLEDYAAINEGAGYDISESNLESPPSLNTSENRYRARIRARFGLRARLDDGTLGEIRIATGTDSSPVSTNQTLGGNGGFAKYGIWLDRANLRLTPFKDVDLVFGRFDNPFRTTELIFDEDLNFDGVALRAQHDFSDGFGVFGTAGAFPIFNTGFNFGSTEAGAFSSKDKYLLAGQLGAEFRPTDSLRLAANVGYFHFGKVRGELSSPCFFDQDVCDTDATRPAFQQFGNSLFPIRNIIPDAANPGDSPEVQYFGLASRFQVLELRGRIDFTGFDDTLVRVEGEFIKNLSFDRSVGRLAVNNRTPTLIIPNPNQDPNNPNDDTITTPGAFGGGDSGWYAQLLVGKADLLKRGDWRLFAGYRRIESDAMVDAFTDSDFHNLGGTNAKGWHLGGGYAFGAGTALNARWISSDSIVGPTFGVDLIQLDLTAAF